MLRFHTTILLGAGVLLFFHNESIYGSCTCQVENLNTTDDSINIDGKIYQCFAWTEDHLKYSNHLIMSSGDALLSIGHCMTHEEGVGTVIARCPNYYLLYLAWESQCEWCQARMHPTSKQHLRAQWVYYTCLNRWTGKDFSVRDCIDGAPLSVINAISLYNSDRCPARLW